jgi:cold shock CspA family protein
MSNTKEQTTSARHSGQVRFFDEKRGWGFITPDKPLPQTQRDLFVHKSAVEEAGLETLTTGQRVTFSVGQHGGRPLAKDLQEDWS